MAKAEEKFPGHHPSPSGWQVNLPAKASYGGARTLPGASTSLQARQVRQTHAVAYLVLLRSAGRNEATVP